MVQVVGRLPPPRVLCGPMSSWRAAWPDDGYPPEGELAARLLRRGAQDCGWERGRVEATARLLKELVRRGLAVEALPAAAALCVELGRQLSREPDDDVVEQDDQDRLEARMRLRAGAEGQHAGRRPAGPRSMRR
jgi:hypothetical protein